jgi:hypothetical protein
MDPGVSATGPFFGGGGGTELVIIDHFSRIPGAKVVNYHKLSYILPVGIVLIADRVGSL